MYADKHKCNQGRAQLSIKGGKEVFFLKNMGASEIPGKF